MRRVRTEVLIVGGGPVGLACAILVARMGVRAIAVERRQSVSYYPKARALTARSLEIFRQMGIEGEVHAAMPPERTRHYAIAPSLVAEDIRLVPFGLGSLVQRDDTPCTGSFCLQDRLEPILAARLAQEASAVAWFGAELLDYVNDEQGVHATVRNADGDSVRVNAQLLVAADGAQGRCAGLAGIGGSDAMVLDPALTVIFKACLAEYIDPLESVYLLLGDPVSSVSGMVSGVSLARDPEEWSVVMTRLPPWGTRLTSETAPLWCDAIRRLTGVADLEVSIGAVAEWQRTAWVADCMASGRVALAGDCAHLMPPAGGLGLNTGLQDAHDLAWRLAAVVHGGGLGLLKDYDRERRPEVARSVDAAVQNYRQGANIDAIWNRPQVGLSLGVCYGEQDERTYPYYDYVPSAEPGRRAPHLWLDAAQQRSVLDLFGRQFVLLVEKRASRLFATAERLRECGAPVVCHALEDMAEPAVAEAWHQLYAGNVLVRPDGIVAWRSGNDDDVALEPVFWQLVHNPARCWARKGECA